MRAAGPPDPMDVILGVHRKIVIHDMRNSVHVDPARRDVCGHEHPNGPGFEILQSAEPLILRAVGMDRSRLDSAALEPARDPIGAALRPGKNEDRVELRVGEQMEQKRGFQVRSHFVGKLRHRVRRVRAPADLNNFRRLLKLVGQRLDLRGERRREHQRLALPRQRAHDLPNRGKKSHVQHPVGFVEHEKFDPGKIADAAAPSNRLAGPASRQPDPRRNATPRSGGVRSRRRRRWPCATEDVSRKRARSPRSARPARASAQPPARVCRAAGPVADGSRELRQDGQHERRRFPRAGLRNPDKIVPGQNVRDGGHLNRGRLGVAGILNGLENLRGKIESAKRHKPGTIVA